MPAPDPDDERPPISGGAPSPAPLPALLFAALDAHAAPAFLVDDGGEVLYASAVGADLYEDDGARWGAELRRRVRAPCAGVSRVEVEGRAPCWLVLLGDVRLDVRERLLTVRRLWTLSDKLARVLELIVEGRTNKAIAADLGVAVVTVEASAKVLAKRAGVSTRPELVAEFWTTRG